MKQKATKFLCSLLLITAIFSICPTYLLSANAVEEGETSEVTRSQWLQELVETFDMTVQDEIYPDNYFSDLSSDSEYYYDMLLAVEFGVVDTIEIRAADQERQTPMREVYGLQK